MNANSVWIVLAMLPTFFILSQAYVHGPIVHHSKEQKETSQSSYQNDQSNEQRFKTRVWGLGEDGEHRSNERSSVDRNQRNNEGFSRGQQSSSFSSSYPSMYNYERGNHAAMYADDDRPLWE